MPRVTAPRVFITLLHSITYINSIHTLHCISNRFSQWQATAEFLLCFYWEGQQVSCSGHPLCFSFLLCILRTCIDSCNSLTRQDIKERGTRVRSWASQRHPAERSAGSTSVISAYESPLSGAQWEAKYLCQIQLGQCGRKLSCYLNRETLSDPLKLHGSPKASSNYCPRLVSRTSSLLPAVTSPLFISEEQK